MKIATLKILILFFILQGRLCLGQASTINNNSTNPSDFLGWDSFTTINSNISHRNSENIFITTTGFPGIEINNNGEIGIGTNSIANRHLNIVSTVNTGSPSCGLIVISAPTENPNIAYAGNFIVRSNGTISNTGVYGRAYSSANPLYSIGVMGFACNQGKTYGVVGAVPNALPNYWAGFFEGDVWNTGTWFSSDENYKINIQPLEDCRSLINSMTPKSYNFKDEFNYMKFPEGLQFGLIAQELEEIMPHAVMDIKSPTQLNVEGEVVHESLEYKGIDYYQLLPVLVGAFKERQEIIQEQSAIILELTAKITEVEDMLNE